MSQPIRFIGGILLGTFLGSLAMLIYHIGQIRDESRQNYIRLSLAQAELATLERTLEIHRLGTTLDSQQSIQTPILLEDKPSSELPLIQPWIGNRKESSAAGITSEGSQSRAGET